MSIDFSAYGIIGVRVNHPTVVTQKRGCSHSEPPGPGVNFCPTCGKPTWKASTELHPILAKIEDEDEYGKPDVQMIHLNGIFYVGFIKLEADYRDGQAVFLSPADLAKYVVDGQRELPQRLGELWNPQEFGLWIVAVVC